MKKILLTIGSVGAIVAPIASVVACSPWDKPKKEVLTFNGHKIDSMEDVRKVRVMKAGDKFAIGEKTVTLTDAIISEIKGDALWNKPGNHMGQDQGSFFKLLKNIVTKYGK